MHSISNLFRTAIESPVVQKSAAFISESQSKVSNVAKDAISLIKNSFENLNKNIENQAQKFKSNLGGIDSPEKKKETFTVYDKSLRSKEKAETKKDPLSVSDPKDANRAAKINQEMNEIKKQNALAALGKDLNKELSGLQNKPMKDADDKEKIERLKLMKGKLEHDPDYFSKKMEEYGGGKVELYTHLKPVAFLSILVKSDQNMGVLENLKKGMGNPSGLSEQERVALYHYTTNAYGAINQAGRDAKLSGKEIEDPGMRACFALTSAALKKLPDAKAIDANGEKVQIKRSYFPPRVDKDPVKNAEIQSKFKTFVEEKMVQGKVFNDGSFLSTTIKGGTPGAINVTFELPEGAATIPNGKKIGFPYSAFSGVEKPDEGEILFAPDVSFEIAKVEGSKVTFKFI